MPALAVLALLVPVALGAAPGAGRPVWTATSNLAGSGFGRALADAGDVDGDGFREVLVTSAAGTSWFRGGPAGLQDWAAWTVPGVEARPAGDVNGDGFADALEAVPDPDGHGPGRGAARLWLGSATGPTGPAWSVESDEPLFGTVVAAAGDVNGDGFSELVVGSPGRDDGEVDEGLAAQFVFCATASFHEDVDGDGLGAEPAVEACGAPPGYVGNDGDDACPEGPANDADDDGVCDGEDRCLGFDDAENADGDAAPDGCDPCPADTVDDRDGDGVCTSDDACPGFPDADDADGDGLPDGCDPGDGPAPEPDGGGCGCDAGGARPRPGSGCS